MAPVHCLFQYAGEGKAYKQIKGGVALHADVVRLWKSLPQDTIVADAL